MTCQPRRVRIRSPSEHEKTTTPERLLRKQWLRGMDPGATRSLPRSPLEPPSHDINSVTHVARA